MPKSTPEQKFAKYYATFMDSATNKNVRAAAKRQIEVWFKRHEKEYPKKWGDIPSILLKAAKDDEKANPPPPQPDPRNDASVQYDPKRHNPFSLVENLVKGYVTMTEHARVIYVLWIIFTHVYERFAVAPRIALVSRHPHCGKSTALEIARALTREPNEEALGTGAAVRDHLDKRPRCVLLDEIDHADKEAQLRLQQIYDIGHKQRGSKISLMVAGRKKLVDLYAPMMVAGVGLLRNFLGPQQLSRTYKLEMERYTAETRPERDFYVEGQVDEEAFRATYTLIRRYSEKAELNPNPEMPAGVMSRYADDMRGMLSIADDCGEEIGRRARAAFVAMLGKEETEQPKVKILRHGLMIFEALELERIPSLRMNKELRRLDVPDATWNAYRGPSGGEHIHPLNMNEQAELLEKSGIKAKGLRPVGGDKQFRGQRTWFEEALRQYESAAATPRLRLITPKADEA
jgi:hypothetical protein